MSASRALLILSAALFVFAALVVEGFGIAGFKAEAFALVALGCWALSGAVP